MTAEEVRPRFGALTRRDGTQIPLVFHPTGDPKRFVARYASDEVPVWLEPGDQLRVDVLGPGQSVVLELSDRSAEGIDHV